MHNGSVMLSVYKHYIIHQHIMIQLFYFFFVSATISDNFAKYLDCFRAFFFFICGAIDPYRIEVTK